MIVDLGIQRGGPMDGKPVAILPVIVGKPVTHLLYNSKDFARLCHVYMLDERTRWANIYRYNGLHPKSDFPHVKA